MPLNLYLTIFIVTSSISFASSQSAIKEFVRQNTSLVNNISPQETDYSDLESIGNAIGDSRIVLLGEQDHGDAPTFLAKTRLIKYLHEKKGFNVLAFESDFFALNFGWDQIEKNKPSTDSFIYKSIYPIWTRCKTCSHLFFEYIPGTYQTNYPIQLTGFDNQMNTTFSFQNLGKVFDSLLRKLALPIVNNERYNSEILPAFDPTSRFKDTTLYDKRILYLKEINSQLATKLQPDDFWIKVVENLIELNYEYQTSRSDRIFSMGIRDKKMAANLKWLSEIKYPNEKIIVWAANLHIAKDAGTFNYGQGPNKKLITMGSVLANDSSINNKMYVLGFTSYHGEAGRLGTKKYAVGKPLAVFFESWIRKDYQYGFTDFRDYLNRNPNRSDKFYLRGFGHMVLQKEEWHKIFDGMFFIRKMYSCID